MNKQFIVRKNEEIELIVKRGRKKVRGTEVRTGKTGSYDDADQRSGKKSPGTAEARGDIGCGYGRDRDPCKRLPSAGKCVADFEWDQE